MKFVALLSGGKDSCFNIMKCQQHSHDLVAVANLMPPDQGIEEMNSFMYQSAAHNTIPSIADCLGVPLFRQGMNRKSLVQTLDYRKDDNDEVEDLFVLLQRVVTEYPEIKGVSCGTIVSNYQRLRVEDVCIRLNLIPLTYLWQRDRALLLDEMISSGVHAVLVKVAGAGLDPYKHLGMDLQSLRPTLYRLNQKFGLDLCGEGGEYETIVLDCPAFKKRLEFSETAILIDEEDCSVGNLRILQFSVVEKTSAVTDSSTDSSSHRTDSSAQKKSSQPLNLNGSMNAILNQLKEPFKVVRTCQQQEGEEDVVLPVKCCIKLEIKSDKNMYNNNNNNNNSSSSGNNISTSISSSSSSSSSSNDNRRKKNTTSFQNLNCLYGKDGIGQTSLKCASASASASASAALQCMKGCMGDSDSNSDSDSDSELECRAVEQMRDIMIDLKKNIESLGSACDLTDACFIHLYLSDIKLFQVVNSEYCKWFDRNPPSRSCVAIPLPKGVLVAADAVFYRESHHTIQLGRSSRRQVLHVRSISEWAPLCIGPYAQANVLANSLIYVAGQIPLDPASMEVFVPTLSTCTPIPPPPSSSSCLSSTTATTTAATTTTSTTTPASPIAVAICSRNRDTVIPVDTVSTRLDMLLESLRVQLTLCLRHVARVLEPLNSSLRHTLGCTVYLNMSVIQRDYNQSTGLGDDRGVINDNEDMLHGWIGWSELASLARQLMACNCNEVIPNLDKKCNHNTGDIEDSDNSDNSDDDENKYENENENESESEGKIRRHDKDKKKGYRTLPVLIVGVKGIPRDCLIEAEVVSFSDMMPISSFASNQCIYHLPVALPLPLPLNLSNTATASELECPLGTDNILHDEAHADHHGIDGVDGSHGDDLDTNLWPIWHRADDCHLKANKDQSLPVVESKNENDNDNENKSENESENKSENERPCGDSCGALCHAATEASSSSSSSSSSSAFCAVNAVQDLDRRLDADCIPEYTLLVSPPTPSTPTPSSSSHQSGTCQSNDSEVLVANIQTTQCSRCVCSGFCSVSLQGNIKESQMTMEKEEEMKEVDGEEKKEEGKKEEEEEHRGKEGGRNERSTPSIFQLGADLLIFTVKEKMIGAGMAMGDIRTFRVYYQYDTLEDLLTPSSLKCGGKDADVRVDVEDDVDVDVRRIVDRLECSLLLAARRAFGEHHKMPFILVPVVQLARPNGGLPLTDTPGRPLLTCSFLFINLLLVKSEIWIGGH